MSRHVLPKDELYRRIYDAGLRPVEVARKMRVSPSVLTRANSGEIPMSAALYAEVLAYVAKVRRKRVIRRTVAVLLLSFTCVSTVAADFATGLAVGLSVAGMNAASVEQTVTRTRFELEELRVTCGLSTLTPTPTVTPTPTPRPPFKWFWEGGRR